MKHKIWILLLLLLNISPLMFSQHCRIGDIITNPDGTRGVVFYLNPDRLGGWMVALDDQSPGCKWGANGDVPGLTNCSQQNSSLMTELAGKENTRIIRAYQNNNTAYAAGLVDFEHGWYLPSIGQLRVLFSQWALIESSMIANGGSALSDEEYWSSTEFSEDNAYGISANKGAGFHVVRPKSSLFAVRAIHDFSFFEWSDGSIADHIEVTPSETTTYTVTVQTGTCGSVDESLQVVVSPVPQDVSINPEGPLSVCEGETISLQAQTSNTGNWVYQWSDLETGQTFAGSGATLQIETDNLGLGQHEIQVVVSAATNENCSGSAVVEVEVSPAIEATLAGPTSVCAGSSFDLIATSTNAGSIIWKRNGIATGWSGLTPSVIEYEPGIYEYTVTISNEVCWDAKSWTVTVFDAVTHDQFETECEEFTWVDGQTYTSSTFGEHTWVYEGGSSHGCDSIVTLYLTINQGTHNVQTEEECETFTWHGTEYTSSGVYVYPYNNENGCPSADTLHLTINHETHNVQTEEECETFTWHGTEYTSSGVYVYPYNNENGCPSADTLHLTINQGTHEVLTATSCGSFYWHGTEYTASGVYVYSYTNESGCPSADTLHLTINEFSATTQVETECEEFTWVDGITYTESTSEPTWTFTSQQGCDSIVTLHLTINQGTHNVQTEEECETFTWHGTEYTASGVYVYPYNNENGCPSADTLHLTINEFSATTQEETECEEFTWVDGITYIESTSEPTWTFTSQQGCDSIVTLHLTINQGTHNVQTEEECETFTWHGTEYTASGVYVYSYTNETGCPSADTLHLTINEFSATTQEETECEEFTWVDGITYTESTSEPTWTFTSQQGCDSIVTLNLTILHGAFNSETISSCGSYEWHGQLYDSDGEYVYEYENENGCPSADTLHLTINQETHNVVTETACESFVWHDMEYTASGEYTYLYENESGCPSADTLLLTINYGTHTPETIVSCGPFTWHDTEYAENGTYTYAYENENGCPSVDTLHLTINEFSATTQEETECEEFTWVDGITYTESTSEPTWTFTSQQGCDSIVTLNLTILHGTFNSDTVSSCGSYEWHGQLYDSDGEYVYEYENENGCPSADTLHLTINQETHNVVTETACESFTWHDMEYTASGEYLYLYENESGCPSADTLLLTINYGTHNLETIVSCGPFTWHDTEYAEDGTYTYAYENENGCPSVDTLHLTISDYASSVDEVTACESFTWIDGETYTESTYGEHSWTFVGGSALGCDSIVTLNLTINHGTHNPVTIASCGPFTWHDLVFDESGTYTYEYENDEGCPSMDTLHLTINEYASTIQVETACEKFTWVDGITYSESTSEPTWTFTSQQGCDSIVTLNLTILHGTFNSTTVTSCDSYEWHGVLYDSDGDYFFTYENEDGCPSADTLHLTISDYASSIDEVSACESFTWMDGETYTESTYGEHSYTFPGGSFHGCDSIVLLYLTIHPLPDANAGNDVSVPFGMAATLQAADAGEGAAYHWEPADLIQMGQGTATVTTSELTETTLFHLTVTLNGCINTDEVTVMVSNELFVSATAEPEAICAGGTTLLTASAFGGSGEYAYTWEPAELIDGDNTLQTVTTLGLEADQSFTVTVDDGNETIPVSVTVTVFPAVTASIEGDTDACRETPVTLTAYPDNMSYLWSTGATTQSITVTESVADTYEYTVTVTSANGCQGEASHTLTMKPLPVADASGTDQQVDLGASATLVAADAGEGAEYHWSPEELIQTGQGTATATTVNLTENTEFNLTVTLNGCQNSDDVMVIVGTQLYATAFANPEVICYEASTTLIAMAYSGSGSYDYTWEPAAFIDGDNTLATVTTLPLTTTTVFTCYVNDGNDTVSPQATVTVRPQPIADAGPDVHVPYDHPVNIHASDAGPGAEYHWSPEELIQTGQGTLAIRTVNLTESTILTLEVTLNGCTSTDEVTVVVGDQLYVTVSAESQSLCPGETTTLTANVFGGEGPFAYWWTPSEFIEGDNSAQTVTTRGLYTDQGFIVVVIDAAGGNDFASVTVSVKLPPIADASGSDHQVDHGTSATLVAADAGEGAIYHWSPEELIQTGQDAATATTIGLTEPTTFTLTVILNGCEASDEVTVNVGDQLYAIAHADPEEVCFGKTTALTVEAMGGAGNYTYLWEPANLIDGDNTSQSVTTRALNVDQTFMVTVTDEAGANCIVPITVTVFPQPEQGNTNMVVHHPVMWNGQVYNESGDYPYTILNGSYQGCDSTTVLHLTVLPALVGDTSAFSCGPFHWHGQTFTQSGFYTHVFHGAGYLDSDTTVLLNLTIEDPTFDTIEVITCEQFQWQGHTLTEPGLYTETLTSENGCDSTVTIDLQVLHPDLQILGYKDVFYASDIWHGIYHYYLTDSTYSYLGSVEWQCTNPEWVVLPAGDFHCVIIVRTPGTGILTAHPANLLGCDDQLSIEISATEFNDHTDVEIPVLVFPNPSDQDVTVIAPNLLNVKVFNIVGQYVMTVPPEHNDTTTIPIENLAQGLYLLQITTSYGVYIEHLIVRQ